MNCGGDEPLFIEASISPPIKVNENMIFYILIFCKNVLF